MESGERNPFAGPQGAIRGRIVGDLNPLNIILAGGEGEGHTYGVGMMFNGLYEGGEKGINKGQIHDLYSKSFSGREDALGQMNSLIEQGVVDKERGAAYLNGINMVYDDMEKQDSGSYGLDPNAPNSEARSPEDVEKIQAGEIIPREIESAVAQAAGNPGGQPNYEAGLASPPPTPEEEELEAWRYV
jgi:hypothetical protein